jgi:hypothetical protein
MMEFESERAKAFPFGEWTQKLRLKEWEAAIDIFFPEPNDEEEEEREKEGVKGVLVHQADLEDAKNSNPNIYPCREALATWVDEHNDPSDNELELMVLARELILLPVWVPDTFCPIREKIAQVGVLLANIRDKVSPSTSKPASMRSWVRNRPCMVTIARSCADGFLPMK